MTLDTEQTTPQNTPAQDALAKWVSTRFKALARGRWAEEREWYQAAMFDQLKQWLENSNDGSKRLQPIKVAKDAKWPMPVSNHFSKAISTNANMLGAAVPEMFAQSDNYDSRNRRAAEAAEHAIDAANKESGMNILVPILAKQTVLWGLGVTKDTIAFDHSTDEVPQMQEAEPTMGPDGQPVEQPPQVVGVEQVPSPRLKTELPMIFQVYLPRDCQDANLSPIVIERPRMDLGLARELFPDFADALKKDEGDTTDSLAQFFMNSLRSLAYTAKDESEDKITLTECWCDWNQLSDDVQDAIEGEWEGEPSTLYPNMSKLEAAVEFGIFVTLWDESVLEWGENPWDGDKPYTFYPWQKDVASVYPKGLSTELVPLQKQLNRIDSLTERAIMSNAAVKLLMPNTQQSVAQVSGDPVEVVMWDPIGDGKVKPEYFGGKAIDSLVMAKREQIVADFAELSYSNSASEGEIPGKGTAFRALAFASAKAEETRKTQRYLWEQAHELRSRKILKMAKRAWSEPRKIQTAGFNNKYGAQLIQSSDLEGEYELEVIQDSSRPKTQTEKMETFQLLLQGGMISPQDPGNREYVTDTLGVSDLNLTDHLQYVKAERDLELVKTGAKPQDNPFMNYGIHLQTFADYIQTEEYEQLAPQLQQGILMYATWLQQMNLPPAPPPGAPGAGPVPPVGAKAGAVKTGPEHPMSKAMAAKGGVGGQPAGHVLGQVPGQTVSPQMASRAAEIEGMQVVPNASGSN